ncbi:MAG: hypothetical protein K0S65_5291, partial [Labilithrix sp.]|nr:hypothetical protein [Labilithrix sp.]
MKQVLSFGLFLLCAAATAPDAHAAPAAALVPATAARITPTALANLKIEVAKARAIDPRAFVAVNAVVSHAADADVKARGRKAPVALYLAKLGPSALMPMLEMLALDAPRGVPSTSAAPLRRDLIEAVGLLKDPRALVVLSAILDDATEEPETTRTVTEAVARIGTDEAATRILSALDASTGDRTRAI